MAFSASMVAGLGGSILNREKSFTRKPTFLALHNFDNLKFEAAIKQIETDLKATSGQVSPVLGVFIILQGVGPLLWCPISEIKGRKVKIPYLVSTHFLSLTESAPSPFISLLL
jgi:MFS family permease